MLESKMEDLFFDFKRISRTVSRVMSCVIIYLCTNVTTGLKRPT